MMQSANITESAGLSRSFADAGPDRKARLNPLSGSGAAEPQYLEQGVRTLRCCAEGNRMSSNLKVVILVF